MSERSRLLPFCLFLLFLLSSSSCGGKSDDPVVILRQERDPGRRGAILKDLVKEKGPKAGDLWERLLRESDAEIPRLTASALGRAADEPGWRDPPSRLLDALMDAAGRGEAAVRVEAILAVGLLYAEDARVPPKVLALLSDPDARVRRAAVHAIQRFGPATGGMDLAPLRGLLRDGELSLDAAAAMAACGDAVPASVERLAAAVENRADPTGARTAGAALIMLGPRAVSAAPRLAKALPGSPPGVARDLADALGLSASPDPAVAAALEKILSSRDEEVRAAAGLALARLGKGGAEAEKALRELAGAKAAEARLRACEGLLLLGKGGAPEWEALTALAADPAPDGQRAAAALLAVGRVCAAGRMPPGGSTEPVEKGAADPRLIVRRAAGRARAAILR